MKDYPIKTILTIFLLISLFYTLANASQDIEKEFDFGKIKTESVEQNTLEPLAAADKLTHEYRITQEKHKLYECMILTVGVIASLVIVLFFITRKEYNTSHIVHACGLVFIVFGTIFVVILSDVDQQLTGSMGILGAVAGYLFGSMQKGEVGKEPKTGKNVNE